MSAPDEHSNSTSASSPTRATLPHHAPEYAFSSARLKKEKSVSNPFLDTYDDGTPIEPPVVQHVHPRGEEGREAQAGESDHKPTRRPSLDDINFDEKLHLHHPENLPRTLSAHAVGPSFKATPEDPHPDAHFHPPGTAVEESHHGHRAEHKSPSHAHQQQHQQQSDKDRAGGEDALPSRYHHYTAPSSAHPRDAMEKDDETYFPGGDRLKTLDVTGTGGLMAHIREEATHYQQDRRGEPRRASHAELQPALLPRAEREAAASVKASSHSPSHGHSRAAPTMQAADPHQRPLFLAEEAHRLAECGYHHTEYASGDLTDSQVFGFVADRQHHTEDYPTNRMLPHGPQTEVSASTVVSSVGNSLLDDEPTLRMVHTHSQDNAETR